MNEFIPSVEDLINRLLDSAGYRPMTRHELTDALGLSGAAKSELRAALRRMEQAGTVAHLRKNRWARPDNGRQLTGELTMSRHGFAQVADPAAPERVVRVAQEDLGQAIHGDRVVVALRSGTAERRPRAGRDRAACDGRVVRVVERRYPRLSGILKRTPYYWYLIPEDPRFPQTVRVRAFADGLEGADGAMAVVELEPWDPHAAMAAGAVVELLGRPGAPGTDVLCVMRQHGLAEPFPAEVHAEERRHPTEPTAADRAGRRDLREAECFTIDPEDAKDFDDAVSLSARPDGGWDLGVHIADVSHYVKPGDETDREALHRGTSVYLVDRTLTMLPAYLTKEVCSLRPGVDRLCHSAALVLDAEGLVRAAETFPSVIRSRACLNYDQVQRCLDGAAGHGLPAALEAAARRMHAVAGILRARRMAAGALDFDVPEVKCVLDAEGRVAEVRPRGSGEAYHLIEEFMLLANQAVARALARRQVPAIYRIHEPPDELQWARMREDLGALGLHLRAPDGPGINATVRRVAGTPLGYPATLAVLRNLKRALYSPRCVPHFGLAFHPYTHFTSPIRRYPDLLVHRMLQALEEGRPPPYPAEAVARMAARCSRCEQEADQAERESVEIKRVEYYRERLRRGETGPFEAVVVGAIPRGLLVELPDTLQRGLVAYAGLVAARRRRDRPHAAARVPIGETMAVELVKVDTYRRLVDFRPMPAAAPARAARRKPRRARGAATA